MHHHIDKILAEWSLRVHNGMPDVKNPLHLVQLRSTLHEMKYSRGFVEGLLEKLRKYADNPQNRKLNRVGEPWGSEGDTKKGKTLFQVPPEKESTSARNKRRTKIKYTLAF